MEPDNTFANVVGKTGKEAQQILMATGFTEQQVPIVQPNMMVTMDYRTDRVRIYVDDNGIVSRVPQRG
jgi:hypothetical protein